MKINKIVLKYNLQKKLFSKLKYLIILIQLFFINKTFLNLLNFRKFSS